MPDILTSIHGRKLGLTKDGALAGGDSAVRISSPCASNSRWHHVRANRPRASSSGSGSMTNAPSSGVSLKITDTP